MAQRAPTSIGHEAEELVSGWLIKEGVEIIARNWRTSRCEIDIVARDQDRRLRFIEVRYRKNDLYGGALESITPDKIKRLQLAARIWLSKYGSKWSGYQIDLAAVSGSPKPNKLVYLPNVIQIG